MQKTNNIELFVRMPVVMFSDTDKQVTANEFIVYYWVVYFALWRDRSTTFVSVDMLAQILKLDSSNASRNKKAILQAIQGLRVKGYLEYENNGENWQYSSLHTIKHPDDNSPLFNEEFVGTNERSKYKGWVAITEAMYDLTSDGKDKGRELMMLALINWRDKIDYQISFAEWAKVLQVSDRTAKTFIQSCEKRGIIVVEHGVYYTNEVGEPRQEMNGYSVNDVGVDEDSLYTEDEMDESDFQHKGRKEDDPKKTASINKLMRESTEKRKHNLFDWSKKITVNDVKIGLTTKCPIVEEWYNKRADKLRENPNTNEMLKRFVNHAKQQIAKETVQQARQERFEREMEDNGSDNMSDEKEYVYKKNESDHVDLTNILPLSTLNKDQSNGEWWEDDFEDEH